jgi:hypothetical protein
MATQQGCSARISLGVFPMFTGWVSGASTASGAAIGRQYHTTKTVFLEGRTLAANDRVGLDCNEMHTGISP